MCDKEFSDGFFGATSIYWRHWKIEGKNVMSVSVPAERYSDIIGKEKFNIVAKSVGTGVAKDFEKGRLFVVQNEKDPLGSFERIKFNRCQRRARLF